MGGGQICLFFPFQQYGMSESFYPRKFSVIRFEGGLGKALVNRLTNSNSIIEDFIILNHLQFKHHFINECSHWQSKSL